MLKKRELATIVLDTRLSPEAVRVILDVARRSDGEHEIVHSHFAALLNYPGEKSVRQAIQVGVDFGYIKRRRGGRGHHMLYSFNPAVFAGLNVSLNPAGDAGLNGSEDADNPAAGAGLNGKRAEPYTDLTRQQEQGYQFNPAPGAGLNAPHTRVSDNAVDVKDVDDEEDKPPIVPLNIFSSTKNAVAEHAEKFKGCRKPLFDYLAARVPDPTRQRAYVMRVLGWLNDLEEVWRLPDGSHLEVGMRTGMLASALNALLAAQEDRMSRDVGDPDNLRTKLEFTLKNWYRRSNERPGANTGTGERSGRRGADGEVAPEGKTGKYDQYVER